MLSASSRTDWSQDNNLSSQTEMDFYSCFHAYCSHPCDRKCTGELPSKLIDHVGVGWRDGLEVYNASNSCGMVMMAVVQI
nr:methyl-CpG-binding domain protein 3-like 1 isoform X3 [Meriones unguiculatus]